MSSYPRMNALTYKCAAAVVKGTVAKPGADEQHLIVSASATSKNVGIFQNDTTTAEDPVEVAHPGGGGLAKLGVGGCAVGDFLTADSSGTLVVTTTPGNFVVAQALKDGLAGDLVPVNVVCFLI